MTFRLIAFLTVSATAVLAADAPAAPAFDLKAAEAYCTSTGGLVEERVPVYGTNGPSSSWLWLSGGAEFCQYTSSTDGSRIHVVLTTLYTTKPTLAALAYYNPPPYTGGNGAPGSLYCSQLGGTDLFGGINAAGGAWVSVGGIDRLLDNCMFPDGSQIDSYGLFYKSDGIIRGINLGTVLLYPDPDTKK
jgi:putative hemolysin